MNRRIFVALLAGGALTGLRPTQAQQPRVHRIGILLVGNREPFWGLFRDGLRDLGYVEGRNVSFEFRSAQGKLQALSQLADELVRLDVNVIVASETPAVQAAKLATTRLPIVMAPSGDPVGTGLVASLARPGGNVTGLSAATAELAGKSLELIREILPSATRVAALADPKNPFTKPFLEHINLAAKALNVEAKTLFVRDVEEFESAFATMAKAKVAAVVVQPTLPRRPAVDLALKYRIPAVSGNRAFAEMGGLMTYAASLNDRYRGAAAYVDKILKGRTPAELPVQQPTRFELVINQKTAKALGIEIPATLIARADDVIE
jgi:putative ABC transport system substrate-binding protein